MANPIDLRSDTVTRPSTAMRRAMAEAPVGDDQYGDDPTVNLLQERMAALLGKEFALFVPSGTMANQLAIRCHCESGDEVVAHEDSHIIHYETGAPAALSGSSPAQPCLPAAACMPTTRRRLASRPTMPGQPSKP